MSCEGSSSPSFANDFCTAGIDEPSVQDVTAFEVSAHNVPGSRATSIRIHGLWNSLSRSLTTSGTRFGNFFAALSRRPQGACEQEAPSAQVWPMPLPYHFDKGSGEEITSEERAFRKLVNAQVGFLNYLHLGKPRSPPPSICGRKPLTSRQWEVVQRFLRLEEAWNLHPCISNDMMGRVAAKQERQEDVLLELQRFVSPIVREGKRYHSAEAFSRHVADPDDVAPTIGTLKKSDLCNAQPVIASRIKMEGNPSFDPRPFLDERSKKLYEDPWSSGIGPDDVLEPPPKVRIHADPQNKIAILRLLEATNRRGFRSREQVVEGFGSGLFCVPKDSSVDRLILDGRPASLLQLPPNRFIYTMASAGTLLGIYLKPTEKLVMTFKTFPESLADEPYVYACLASLAMGDSAACEYAQTSHISLGLQCGAFKPEELITLHGRIPRGPSMAGIIIDDLILLEKVAMDATVGLDSTRKRKSLHDMYNKVGLQAHPSKGFANQTNASFWGADVDGEAGLVRGSIVRAISLCWVTSKVARMRVCSINLLEVIAGGFVSLFSFRKRMLSLLDGIYAIQRGKAEKDIISLPDSVVEELWSLVVLCPLAVSDLRAAFSSRIYMCDASSWGDAVVESELGQCLGQEIHRHSASKSAWTHLLSPWKALQRSKGLLPVEEELPAGEQFYEAHPLWEVAARGLQYKVLWKRFAKPFRHINIGELQSFTKAEELAGLQQCDIRIPIGSDSQVTIGAVCKGRSASTALNNVLSKSLPSVLGFGIYSCTGYIPSAYNPSDDPTRGTEIRKPDIELPAWWESASEGNFSVMDDFLERSSLLPEALAGYPSLGELQNFEETNPKRKQKQHRARIKLKLKNRNLKKSDDDSGNFQQSNYPFSHDVRDSFAFFGKEQFIFGTDSSWPPTQAGLIDLYSGKKGYAKSASKQGAPWVLCIDIEDGAHCDLLNDKVRKHVECLIRGKAVKGFSAAPICSSFSRAITPAVRSRQYPRGFPWIQGTMKQKLLDGNRHSRWLGKIICLCIDLGIHFWVENPDSSCLWIQPEWLSLGAHQANRFFKTDFCRFSTPWRKRTRFFTDTRLRGVKRLCNRDHIHMILRGRSAKHKQNWTKIAEPYPYGLCKVLATAMVSDCGWNGPHSSPDFCNTCRIGEASNPGPRRKNGNPKDPADLDNVQLIRPETVAIGRVHWQKFLNWLDASLNEETIMSLWRVPSLMGSMLAAYGRYWYGEGGALYAFRHLVVYMQRMYPGLKGGLQEAWTIISKWEEIEPVVHRKPVPLAVIKAFVVTAIHWRWYRFAAVILMTFYGCARPGEVLNGLRSNLVLPSDIGERTGVKCFIRICKPKPGRRGLGRTQHAVVNDADVTAFLERIYKGCKGSEPLYPGSAAAFRSRWDTMLRQFNIPTRLGLTPGSLRAGGTVHLYKQGVPILDILWALRLKNLETLQHYLQEISTDVTMIDMHYSSRQLILNMSTLFQWALSAPLL
eukprot:Skav224779  [mRNA]  locus=scaffold4598:69178:73705:- [translate_table: standard]